MIPDSLPVLNLTNEIKQAIGSTSFQNAKPQNSLNDDILKQFAEPHNDFSLPGGSLINQNINLLYAGLGVLASGAIVSLVSKHLTMVPAKWAGIIAGVLLITLGKKNKMIKDFGVGVVLGGIALAFENISDMLTDRFGERKAFDEQRTTWGGLDGGLQVTSPERRTIS